MLQKNTGGGLVGTHPECQSHLMENAEICSPPFHPRALVVCSMLGNVNGPRFPFAFIVGLQTSAATGSLSKGVNRWKIVEPQKRNTAVAMAGAKTKNLASGHGRCPPAHNVSVHMTNA